MKNVHIILIILKISFLVYFLKINEGFGKNFHEDEKLQEVWLFVYNIDGRFYQTEQSFNAGPNWFRIGTS